MGRCEEQNPIKASTYKWVYGLRFNPALTQVDIPKYKPRGFISNFE